ncbi:MAG: ABC transporter ATP-binding protein [Betaproteobacteria bacterium]|nr:ABC transporter ATP-binding protein [Betaproteobacteria bacterium]
MTEAVLSVDKLSAFYGKLCAVRDASFEIGKGETVCVIGPNGAGKTSLLKALSGTLSKTTGVVRYRGQVAAGLSPEARVRRGLIHVPEGRQVFASMTVEENIELGAYARRVGNLSGEIESALRLFPRLMERRKQLAGTLSGGEQQMLAMARAVIGHPQLLMLDEPSMGVAPIMVAEIYKQVQALREQGVTILLVEQNARIALGNSDRALVIASGEIRHQARSSELLKDGAVAGLVFGH